MKKKILLLLFIPIFTFLSFSFSSKNVFAEGSFVFLGGEPAGFTLYTRGATVVGLCDVVNGEQICSPAKDAQIEVGDVILSIDNQEINTAKDIERAIKNGNEKLVEIKRGNQNFIKQIKPQKDNQGYYKMGLFIKEGVNGVGTITYYTENKVGCLGHAVLDDDFKTLNVTGGKIFECSINGVIKGVKGRPGELRGLFSSKNEFAVITKNCDCGVYGNLNSSITTKKEKIEIGEPVMGDAYIYTTVFGSEPKKYSISIIKKELDKGNKNLVIKITDKELLEVTGGIVQGMSGSPIVQNGKLVGAVTHVFTNDPTRGFGIDIDNMIINN